MPEQDPKKIGVGSGKTGQGNPIEPSAPHEELALKSYKQRKKEREIKKFLKKIRR